MKLPNINYNYNVQPLQQRDINAPIRIANAQAGAANAWAGAASAQAGAAGQQASAARAEASLYEGVGKGVDQVAKYYYNQEADAQYKESVRTYDKLTTEYNQAELESPMNPDGTKKWDDENDTYAEGLKKQMESVRDGITNNSALESFSNYALNKNDKDSTSRSNWLNTERKKYNSEVAKTSIMDAIESKDYDRARVNVAESIVAGTITDPTSVLKYNEAIDYAQTVDTETNIGLSYIENSDMRNLTQWKAELATNKELKPQARRSIIAAVEEEQINKSLEVFHAEIQKTEQEQSLDAAVVEGQKAIDQLLRTESELIGGDDKFKSDMHTKLRTELARYKTQLNERDKTGMSMQSWMSNPMLSSGYSDQKSVASNNRMKLFMGGEPKGKNVAEPPMPTRDILKSDTKAATGVPLRTHIFDETVGTGLLPKIVSNAINASVSDPAAYKDALGMVKELKTKFGSKSNAMIYRSGLDNQIIETMAYAELVGEDNAIKTMMSATETSVMDRKTYESPEMQKVFNEAWDSSANNQIQSVVSEKGWLGDDAEVNAADMVGIKMLAKTLYPKIKDPNATFKTAAIQYFTGGQRVVDYSTDDRRIVKTTESLAYNIPGGENLSKSGQYEIGQVIKNDIDELNGGDASIVSYQSAGNGVTSVVYIDEDAMVKNVFVDTTADESPEVQQLKQDIIARDREIRSAQKRKYIAGQVEDKLKAGVAFESIKPRDVMLYNQENFNQGVSKFWGTTTKAINGVSMDYYKWSAGIDEMVFKSWEEAE